MVPRRKISCIRLLIFSGAILISFKVKKVFFLLLRKKQFSQIYNYDFHALLFKCYRQVTELSRFAILHKWSHFPCKNQAIGKNQFSFKITMRSIDGRNINFKVKHMTRFATWILAHSAKLVLTLFTIKVYKLLLPWLKTLIILSCKIYKMLSKHSLLCMSHNSR